MHVTDLTWPAGKRKSLVRECQPRPGTKASCLRHALPQCRSVQGSVRAHALNLADPQAPLPFGVVEVGRPAEVVDHRFPRLVRKARLDGVVNLVVALLG